MDDNMDVGNMVYSSLADERKLIELVKQRKLLYARSKMPVASYLSRVRDLWEEVAAEMNWDVAEVRRKWSHIRNSYSRHLRHQVMSTRTATGRSVSRWHLADHMDFLKGHMATDVLKIPRVPISLCPMESISAGHQATPPNQPLDDSNSTTSAADDSTSYSQFFRSLREDYDRLPVKKQRLFRRKCLLVLHELLENEENVDTNVSHVFLKQENRDDNYDY